MIEQDFIIDKGIQKFMSVREEEMNLISGLEVINVTFRKLESVLPAYDENGKKLDGKYVNAIASLLTLIFSIRKEIN